MNLKEVTYAVVAIIDRYSEDAVSGFNNGDCSKVVSNTLDLEEKVRVLAHRNGFTIGQVMEQVLDLETALENALAKYKVKAIDSGEVLCSARTMEDAEDFLNEMITTSQDPNADKSNFEIVREGV